MIILRLYLYWDLPSGWLENLSGTNLCCIFLASSRASGSSRANAEIIWKVLERGPVWRHHVMTREPNRQCNIRRSVPAGEPSDPLTSELLSVIKWANIFVSYNMKKQILQSREKVLLFFVANTMHNTCNNIINMSIQKFVRPVYQFTLYYRNIALQKYKIDGQHLITSIISTIIQKTAS